MSEKTPPTYDGADDFFESIQSPALRKLELWAAEAIAYISTPSPDKKKNVQIEDAVELLNQKLDVDELTEATAHLMGPLRLSDSVDDEQVVEYAIRHNLGEQELDKATGDQYYFPDEPFEMVIKRLDIIENDETGQCRVALCLDPPRADELPIYIDDEPAFFMYVNDIGALEVGTLRLSDMATFLERHTPELKDVLTLISDESLSTAQKVALLKGEPISIEASRFDGVNISELEARLADYCSQQVSFEQQRYNCQMSGSIQLENGDTRVLAEPCDLSAVLVQKVGFRVLESPDGKRISFLPQLMAYHAAGQGDIPVIVTPHNIKDMSSAASILDDIAGESAVFPVNKTANEAIYLEVGEELLPELTQEVERLEQLAADTRATLTMVNQLAEQQSRTEEAAYRLAEQASNALVWLQGRYNSFSEPPEIILQGTGIRRLVGDIKKSFHNQHNDSKISGSIEVQDVQIETPVYGTQIGTLAHGFCLIKQDEVTGLYQIHPTIRLVDVEGSRSITSIYYENNAHRPMLEISAKAYFEYDLSKGVDEVSLTVLQEIHQRQHAQELLKSITEKDPDLGEELLAIGRDVIGTRDSGKTSELDWSRFEGLQAYLPLLEDQKQVSDTVDFLNVLFGEGCLVGIVRNSAQEDIKVYNGALRAIELNDGQMEIYIEEENAIVLIPFCQVLNFVISNPEEES